MALTHLHIRFIATRLLLFEALRLLSDTDAAIWKTTVEVRLIELRQSDEPGSALVVEDLEEMVRSLDFIRREGV